MLRIGWGSWVSSVFLPVLFELPPCGFANDWATPFGCSASYVRWFQCFGSVGQEEVVNVFLCPKVPCSLVLDIVYSDYNFHWVGVLIHVFQIPVVGPCPRSCSDLTALGYRPVRRGVCWLCWMSGYCMLVVKIVCVCFISVMILRVFRLCSVWWWWSVKSMWYLSNAGTFRVLYVMLEVYAKFLGYACAGLGACYFCKFRFSLFAACDWPINRLFLSLLYRPRSLRFFEGVREVEI